tara:strand:- start:91 stop:351 length:261 start_codon:yes stop_codon:yes gene_type:complete
MEKKNSHLTIRKDLVEDGLSVPIHFLDRKVDEHIEDSDSLNINCVCSTPNGEELHEGMGIIISVTEPKFEWKERLAYAHSIDFDWN